VNTVFGISAFDERLLNEVGAQSESPRSRRPLPSLFAEVEGMHAELGDPVLAP
jgi:hypothetical protein